MNFKNYYRGLIIFGLCLYGLYLRVSMRASLGLWADEKWQIHTMHLPFIDFVKSIPRVEHSGYLALDYFLLYPFYQLFGENKWGLAIPHILITMVGFYLLYRICKLYYKTIWGYIIAFGVVCLNANLIFHAFELRTYAILPTLAMGAFLFSQQLVEENVRMSIKKKMVIGIFFILVIWSFSYGIVILSMALLFSLLNKRTDPRFGEILKNTSTLMFFVLFIAMPLWIYSTLFAHLGYRSEDTFQYIPNPLINFVGFLKGILGNLVGNKKVYFLLIGLLFPLILPYKERFQQVGLLLLFVVLPITLLLIAALKAHYWFIQRHFLWCMPFFALFLGWTWDSAICYIRERFMQRKYCPGVNGKS